MTHREAFAAAAARLAAGPYTGDTPELDARVLLGHATRLDHASLLARWKDVLDQAALSRFEQAVSRRLTGEPVAWITGFKEFLGMEFETPPGLLVPRADTETLVESAREQLQALLDAQKPSAAQQRPLRIVDVCTGTGCVAVGIAALAPPPVEIWAGDISPLAVATARRNAERLLSGDRLVNLVESDLLEALSGPWDLIVSNPPYLTTAETRERVERLGWKEPALALDGGADGLEVPIRLIDQASERLAPAGWLLMEAAGNQMKTLREFLVSKGFVDVRTWSDLAGVERVISARQRGD